MLTLLLFCYLSSCYQKEWLNVDDTTPMVTLLNKDSAAAASKFLEDIHTDEN